MGGVPDSCGLPGRARGGAVRARRSARGLPGDAVGGQPDAATGGPTGPCPTRPGPRPWRRPDAFARHHRPPRPQRARGGGRLRRRFGLTVVRDGRPPGTRARVRGPGRRMRATRRSTGPSFLPVAGRGSPRARRTPAHHRPDPSCGPTGPRRRGGPRVPGRQPERAHPAGARGPGPPVDGRSNREIPRALVVTQRTVAAHIEHIMVKLVTPTRTLAAVRAERAGLYVPCVPGLARGEAQ